MSNTLKLRCNANYSIDRLALTSNKLYGVLKNKKIYIIKSLFTYFSTLTRMTYDFFDKF